VANTQSIRRRAYPDVTTPTQAGTLADEQHYSPSELGQLWGLSSDFMRDRFKDEPGVIKIDRPETLHKRGYRTIRIPSSVARRVHSQMAA
jgi:hypothetical protein